MHADTPQRLLDEQVDLSSVLPMDISIRSVPAKVDSTPSFSRSGLSLNYLGAAAGRR